MRRDPTGEVTGSPDGLVLLSSHWAWARREPSSAPLGPISGRYERKRTGLYGE